MWKRYDNPITRTSASYHGSAFPNIDITVSAVPFSRQALTLIKMEFGLVVIASHLQEQSFWPSVVTARIVDRISSEYVGIIMITDSPPSDPPANENITISNATNGNDSTITGSTGEGIANFNPICKDTKGLCQPVEIVAAGQLIPDKVWLGAFHSIISRCFVYDRFRKIRDLLPPSRIWSANDLRGTVQMTLQFYDAALYPSPMFVEDVVLGLLIILRQWAQRDVWKEGWGLIEKGGTHEASLQIRIIPTGAGVTNA
ncbi:MAG: hypothetical protein Q9191_002605 [Dirinaria sp. TL-2023a]